MSECFVPKKGGGGGKDWVAEGAVEASGTDRIKITLQLADLEKRENNGYVLLVKYTSSRGPTLLSMALVRTSTTGFNISDVEGVRLTSLRYELTTSQISSPPSCEIVDSTVVIKAWSSNIGVFESYEWCRVFAAA